MREPRGICFFDPAEGFFNGTAIAAFISHRPDQNTGPVSVSYNHGADPVQRRLYKIRIVRDPEMRLPHALRVVLLSEGQRTRPVALIVRLVDDIQAQLIAQQAELTFQQAKSTELLYEQTAAAWNEQYAAALSQAQLLEQAAAAAAEAALVLPTPENQAAAAVTLEQAQTALQAAAQIESEVTVATQGWITAQQGAEAARADADNALAAAQAAQLMIQIPE